MRVFPDKIIRRRKTFAALLLAFCLLGASALPCGSGSPSGLAFGHDGGAVDIKSLGGWSRSGEAAQTAYLRGLLDMLELERDWQGDRPLSLKRSLAGTWSMALADVEAAEIRAKLLLYCASYPDRLDMPVLYGLWDIYVRPAPIYR